MQKLIILCCAVIITNSCLAQRQQSYEDAYRSYLNFLSTGRSSSLDSAYSVLKERNRFGLDKTLPEKFVYNIVNLEKIKLDLRVDRKNPQLCNIAQNQIQMLWASLVNQELRTFGGYSFSTSPDVMKLQTQSYYWYDRFLNNIIDFGLYFDNPSVLTPIAINATRRILTYQPIQDTSGTENYITQEGILYWTDFYEMIDVEYPNFCFAASLWRGEYPDTTSFLSADSLTKERMSAHVSTAHYNSALACARSNIGKYLATAALGFNLLQEARLADNNFSRERNNRDAIYYFEEALSIKPNLQQEIQKYLTKASPDTSLTRLRLLRWKYNSDIVTQAYMNALESYAQALEGSNKLLDAVWVWEKLWHFEDLRLSERERFAREIFPRTTKALHLADELRIADVQLRRIQTLHHSVENEISKLRSLK